MSASARRVWAPSRRQARAAAQPTPATITPSRRPPTRPVAERVPSSTWCASRVRSASSASRRSRNSTRRKPPAPFPITGAAVNPRHASPHHRPRRFAEASVSRDGSLARVSSRSSDSAAIAGAGADGATVPAGAPTTASTSTTPADTRGGPRAAAPVRERRDDGREHHPRREPPRQLPAGVGPRRRGDLVGRQGIGGEGVRGGEGGSDEPRERARHRRAARAHRPEGDPAGDDQRQQTAPREREQARHHQEHHPCGGDRNAPASARVVGPARGEHERPRHGEGADQRQRVPVADRFLEPAGGPVSGERRRQLRHERPGDGRDRRRADPEDQRRGGACQPGREGGRPRPARTDRSPRGCLRPRRDRGPPPRRSRRDSRGPPRRLRRGRAPRARCGPRRGS